MASRRRALLAKLRVVAVERVVRARAGLDGDWTEGERETHTLKGEAQLLGKPGLAAVAGSLERLFGAGGGRDEARALIEEGLGLLEELAGELAEERAEERVQERAEGLAETQARAAAGGEAVAGADAFVAKAEAWLEEA